MFLYEQDCWSSGAKYTFRIIRPFLVHTNIFLCMSLRSWVKYISQILHKLVRLLSNSS